MEILFRKLICDIDGTTIQQSASTSSPAMRESAFGWTTMENENGKVLDVCPECAKLKEVIEGWKKATVFDMLMAAIEQIDPELMPMITTCQTLPSTEITPVSIAANHLLTVSFNSLNVESGNLSNYSYYNVYIGTAVSGPFYLQNISPIPIGTVWTEPVGGVTPGFYSVLTSILVPDTSGNAYSLSISSSGLIQTTFLGFGISTVPTFLTDSSGQTWLLQVQPNGMLTTTQEISLPQINPVFINPINQIWKLFVNTSGELETAQVQGGDIAAVAPIVSTITPILGYVIAFRYQRAKIPITQSSQILQIPDDYFDVVIAGVNYYANLYTAKMDDEQVKTGLWKREFMEGLSQIRRDLRINFRNTDVISPDPTSQYMIGTQTGYAWPYNES
ncbi:unnamed protein product [Sphagnum jensenii]